MKQLVLLSMAVFVLCVFPGSAPDAQAAPTQRENLAQALVAQGEQSLAKGHLTQPSYDNAYDRFAAALLLDPHSEAAKAGVQAVLSAYLELIGSHLRAGRLGQAEQLLQTASQYYPNSEELREMRQSLAAARRAQPKAETPPDGAIPLPLEELNARGKALRTRLHAIAQRIRDIDASVLIYARTDEEGRYIYSVLKSAVPGYLIRGDIRIHPRPRLQLEEPL